MKIRLPKRFDNTELVLLPPAVDGELETRKALFLSRIFLSGGKSPSFLSVFYSEGEKKQCFL